MAAIFGRFSNASQAVLEEAQRHAERLGRPVQTDIILLSILSQGASSATELLKNVGATYTKLFENLPPHFNIEVPGKVQEIQILLEESIKLAGKYRFNFVEVEHILYVIARDERLIGNMLLRKSGIEPGAIVARLSEWMFSVSMMSQGQAQETDQREQKGDRTELEKYTIDLTEAAEEGTLDPVIGREKEIDQMIRILLRRRKNNPLLVGEPGVGKTALVDGLAQRIVEGLVPKALADMRVLTLDLSLVVAGTMYRGQFEERLKNIIQEVQVLENIILFVDEIHTLSGTGSAEGGFDAANILKPALARGELSLIGATTHEEYRKHILKDKALDRRFQTLSIEEPSSKETLHILKGVRREFEAHHLVRIPDETLQTAVDLSVRYVHDRFLPDKAIDLIDEAAALHAEPFDENDEIEKIQDEMAELAAKKVDAVERATTDIEYEYARKLSERETIVLQRFQELKKQARAIRRDVITTPDDVAHVVATRTGVPIREIKQALEPVDIGRVEATLSKHVLGQDAAIKAIGRTLLRAQLGLGRGKKPMGSFLLVGPTGVGKTETARILAREVFGDAKALIKVDMSEYMERHTVSNLVGAPAGYVGFEQGGSLTEQVRRRPYAVILFDEVEKAHPDVFNILLQVLEDGVLTDNTGKAVSFEHTLILMTSNIGMKSLNQAARIGFDTPSDNEAKKKAEALENHVSRELKDFFRPELLGRMSGILHYRPLDKPVVKKLVQRHMAELKAALKGRGIAVKLSAEALTHLVNAYDPEAGARSIDRLFLTQVEPALIEKIALNSDVKAFEISLKNDTIIATHA
jgi:ATP-dependent Clp protease ATP-binding subunit ClpC